MYKCYLYCSISLVEKRVAIEMQFVEPLLNWQNGFANCLSTDYE